MRQNELDFIELLSSAPVLNSTCPAMASVTQAMHKDDGSRVAGCRREDEREFSRHLDFWLSLWFGPGGEGFEYEEKH